MRAASPSRIFGRGLPSSVWPAAPTRSVLIRPSSRAHPRRARRPRAWATAVALALVALAVMHRRLGGARTDEAGASAEGIVMLAGARSTECVSVGQAGHLARAACTERPTAPLLSLIHI